MTSKKTSAPQRRARATDAAMQRRATTTGASRLSGTTLAIIGVGLLVIIGLTTIAALALLSPGAAGVVGTPESMDGRTHIEQGTAGGPYSSVPAASGPHWPQPIEWGVYTQVIPQEPAIHNLEHGGIVIWYQADQVSAEELTALTNYTKRWNASERYKVILAQWGGEDFGHPMAMVAWTWLLDLDTVDTELMDKFIDQHYGQSPEPAGGPGPPAQ